ncbi:DUF2157 domain-containing protein [Flagellimonas allohymeniacidonis]|uniref:DUF2157 domain-containing protein n=2 Tax=Flagellimonas allohymeniacidonis TaxID=2517819 RepID=A0A4Q8QIH8_9FLAO|nr:DUF2157 domain-containing protein [Allomuricauda hymeniacidonis]
MSDIKREDIHIIGRYSSWSEKGIETMLKDHVYNSKASWQKFLRLLFISLGVGFTAAGIIFFFAYNWAELHKFVKIGLIEGLIILITAVVLFSKHSLQIKNILLTGASILVGVLFAVFGQVYQTGANAYDFFLSWTLFITLWVLISNFAPLWLIFITLVNTTLILYAEQVAHSWSEVFLFTLLFGMNSLFLIGFLAAKKIFSQLNAPKWFLNLLGLASASFGTIGVVIGIFDDAEPSFLVLILLAFLLYALGILYGLRKKSGFYLSIIPFSIIICLSAYFIKLSDSAGMFFFIGLFVIASVTLVIKKLIDFQKKWTS